MHEDLNTPKCLGALFKLLNEEQGDAISSALPDLSRLLFALGIQLFDSDSTPDTDTPDEIVALAERRWISKKQRDFATADALREEVRSRGWTILDRKDGYDIHKQNP